MKLVAKLLLGLCALAGLLLAVAWWILSGAQMPSIPPARTAPPSGFNAALYPEFSAVSSNDQAAVLHIDAYGQPGGEYMIPSLAITYFILSTPAGQARILFVNSSGALIGDITDQPLLFPMGTFMVTPDAYYAVTANGVSARRSMEDVTGLGAAQLSGMIADSTHYRSFASTDLPESDPHRVAGRSVHVMRHNGMWKRAASADLGQRDWKEASFKQLDAVYQIVRPTAASRSLNFFGGQYRVELTHFDQRTYLPGRSAVFGSTTGLGSPEEWVGTGYYTVFRDGAPVLRFRIDDDSDILSTSGQSKLIANGNTELDLLVLIHTNQQGQKTAMVVGGR